MTGTVAIDALAVSLSLIGTLILITGRYPPPNEPAEIRRFTAAVHDLPFGRAALRTCLGAFAAALIGFGLDELL
ncbi:hypothetical protein ACFQ0G_47820 [Streptomyces chiangmaiensis]